MERVLLFSGTVDQVSDSILSLLKLFEDSDLSLLTSLRDLDDDLLALANTIISLSRQIQNGYDNGDYLEEEDSSLFDILTFLIDLVENAKPCISRLERNIINILRSGWANLDDYIEAAELDGELQHLRLRITVYKTATSIPVMMYTTHPLFSQINLPSTTLASRTIQHTLTKLSQDTQLLNTDTRIRISPLSPHSPPNGSQQNASSPQSLHHQRIDLVAILTPLQAHLQGLISQQPTRSPISSRPTSSSSSTPYFPPHPTSEIICSPPPLPPPVYHLPSTPRPLIRRNALSIRGRNRPPSSTRSRSLSASHTSTSSNYAPTILTPSSAHSSTLLTPSSPISSTITNSSLAPFYAIPSFIQPPPSPNPALNYTQSFPVFSISVLDLEPRVREAQTGEHGDDLVSMAQSMNSLEIWPRRRTGRSVDSSYLRVGEGDGKGGPRRSSSWN
ncbi:hypothetical protein B0J11DRAFT_578287 [Dendryphion nanum]|uniref:Uncharacterized protein n=1 Tax=Dendryphion nanum TaxID=256645 RepID=A0A9P9E4J6_9PLEO|nr:hypothetical protein B0J11DRAFT_578287 [Dendryphion nanum]